MLAYSCQNGYNKPWYFGCLFVHASVCMAEHLSACGFLSASTPDERGMLDMKSTIAAIDFGTSKIVTLVAEISGGQRCDIIGAGSAPYDGFMEGEWNNPAALNDAIQATIENAEKQSKRKVREINVGVPGEFTRVYAVETTVDIQGMDQSVTARHVEMIFDKADKQLSPVRGIVIHRSPAWFMVDGGKNCLLNVDTANNNNINIYENTGLPLFHEITNRLPMVYSASLNQNIATRSLLSGLAFKRQILWVDLGVTFKF